MIMDRHNIQWLSWIMVIVFVVFVSCTILVYLSPTFRTSDFYSAFQNSLLSKNHINSAILNSIEDFIPSGVIEVRNDRYTQSWKYIVYYVVFYINISLLSSAKSILCQFLFLANRVNKYIPIIALPIGGHDPPERSL